MTVEKKNNYYIDTLYNNGGDSRNSCQWHVVVVVDFRAFGGACVSPDENWSATRCLLILDKV